VVLAAVALLAFMAQGTSGPASVAFPRSRAGGSSLSAAEALAPRTGYGAQLVPSAERVSPWFRWPPRSGLLFDVKTGGVLWEKNPQRVVPIASLTKMMTALVVVAHSRPAATALITPAATHFEGSGVGLLPVWKRVSVRALLYGLLLPSGNDAAIALAQHVAGTRPHFIGMMNADARRMGLRCTHFNSVSGIVDQGNYSCATDLAIIAHAVLKQPLLSRIVATRSTALPFPIQGGKLFLDNNNPLLVSGYPGADGVKTGYTSASGRCLVATARRGPRWLGVVLLNSADPPDQAQRLLDAGFAKHPAT
jgi:D-alanyl-D-alanine carboxypeptidase